MELIKMNWHSRYKNNKVKFAKPKQAQTDEEDLQDLKDLPKHEPDRIVPFISRKDKDDYQSYYRVKNSPDLNKVIEQMFPGATPIGSGVFGIAYDYKGKVLKITTDETEFVYANYFKDNPSPGIIPVHKIYILDDDMYGILTDKVTALTEVYNEDILIDDMYNVLDRANYGLISHFRYMKGKASMHVIEYLANTKDQYYNNDLLLKYAILMQQLSNIGKGFCTGEAHATNVGLDINGQMVLFDLGIETLSSIDRVVDSIQAKNEF